MRDSLNQQLVLVVIIGLVAFIVGLGLRELGNPVEPRYAGMALDMAQGGPSIVPLNGGQHYDQKPPLGLWAAAAALKAGGGLPSEFLVRLPGALMGILGAIGVLLLGRMLFGGHAGLFAAVILQTMWIVYWSGRFYHLDVPLMATVVWAIFSWLRAAATQGQTRRWWMLLSWLALSIGVFLKGPPALVFPILVLVSHALVFRDSQVGLLRRLLPVSILSIIPTAVWFLIAYNIAGDGWAEELLINQGLLRLVSEAHSGKHGILYYPTVFWGIAAPWSLFLPAALGFLSIRWKENRRGTILCIAWFLAIFTLLMLGASRRSRYLMPALPAIALLVGAGLDQGFRLLRAGQVHRRWLMWNLRIVFAAAGFLVSVAGFVLVMGGLGQSRFLPSDVQEIFATARWLSVWGAASSGTAIYLLVNVWREQWRRAFWSLTAAVCVLVLTWSLSCAPAMDRFKDYETLREVLQGEMASGAEFFIAGTHAKRESVPGYYRFYLGRSGIPAGVDGVLLAERARQQQPTVVLVTEKELRRSPDVIPSGYTLHPRGPFARSKMLVYIAR